MADKNNFYVMDDAYIEEKYVRAEESRQKEEEAMKKQRELDEIQALQEAEKQRKAADEERRRRNEENERMAKLEEARTKREEMDKMRKEKELSYQKRLEDIEKELQGIQERKSKFLDEKLTLAKSQAGEEAVLKETLELIVAEKKKIFDREQNAKFELDSYLSKARAKTVALENEEKHAESAQKALTQERRDVQNEMLNFLQNPIEVNAPVQKQPYVPKPVVSKPPAQSQHRVQHQPVVQQPVVKKSQNDITDQLAMLDGLLANGVMNKEEYDANRKEAMRAAGITETSATPGNPELDAQIAQLDDFLRQGILQKAEYDDAKKRVMDDFKGKPAPTQGNNSGLTQVAVVVPAGKYSGDQVTISFLGRNYDVVIPPGLTTGQQFHAAIPS